MNRGISHKEINNFTKTVWGYYEKYGRHDLPWRENTDPYSIVVSEIMLQQTQVSRVLDYYKNWKKIFPNWNKLAKAELRDVLKEWKGLGYNRRGKYLHDIAKRVSQSQFPKDGRSLRDLPGIGEYTASAIEAFSFNHPSILIETNIRTAVIYHFFKNKNDVSDKEIRFVLEQCIKPGTKAHKNPREWYWALMDYGSHLKQEVGNLNKKSKTYSRQTRFEGSSRQLRSQILHYIVEAGPVSTAQIKRVYGSTSRSKEIESLLTALQDNNMIKKTKDKWSVN